MMPSPEAILVATAALTLFFIFVRPIRHFFRAAYHATLDSRHSRSRAKRATFSAPNSETCETTSPTE